MSWIPFDKASLGFYSQEDLAYFLDVAPRTVRDWLSRGQAPAVYETKILRASTFTQFPLDEPPPRELIGAPAWYALDVLRRGQHETAAYITYPATGGRDWKTGEEKVLQPLERAYLDLAQGIAWVRSPKAKWIGFELMKRLRRTAGAAYQKAEPDERQHWRYVYIVAANYGLPWLWGRWEKQLRRRIAMQKRLCAYCKTLLALAQGKPYLRVLTAWHAAQFAALANDNLLFIDALGALEDNHCNPMKFVIAKLEGDDDTAVMLKDSRVAALVRIMRNQ